MRIEAVRLRQIYQARGEDDIFKHLVKLEDARKRN